MVISIHTVFHLRSFNARTFIKARVSLTSVTEMLKLKSGWQYEKVLLYLVEVLVSLKIKSSSLFEVLLYSFTILIS